MPIDFANIPNLGTWQETFRRRGLTRVPSLGATPSEVFYGFNGDCHVTTSAAGATSNGVEATITGGNFFTEAGNGAATGQISVYGVAATSAIVAVSNPKTKNWYCAVWGKYVGTKVNNQTLAVWCFNTGGGYQGLGVQQNTATVYQFVAGATTISSTVTIDTAANVLRLFEFWHDVSAATISIAVDDEVPVSATDANLGTTAAQFMNRVDTGTGTAAQRLTQCKMICITEKS